ncbi:MAG: hypothetical protein V1701_02980 [Planctomycetota bacterium]
MNEHTEMAENFLRRHNVKFSARFIAYDYHFVDDKEPRDIFNVSFSRAGKKFSLRFGQSINKSGRGGFNPPTAYDVLSAIQKYPVGTFEDFCADSGYDTDSIKALNTYKLVVKEWDKVSSFFNGDELEELQEIN